jgi:hypothetical protein
VADEESVRSPREKPESTSLPSARSFVVQFTTDTAPASGRFRGRVEHIASARAERFASLDDLERFFADVIALETVGEDESD